MLPFIPKRGEIPYVYTYKSSDTALLRVATSEEGDPFFIVSLLCLHCYFHYSKQRKIAVGGPIGSKLLFVLAFEVFWGEEGLLSQQLRRNRVIRNGAWGVPIMAQQK